MGGKSWSSPTRHSRRKWVQVGNVVDASTIKSRGAGRGKIAEVAADVIALKPGQALDVSDVNTTAPGYIVAILNVAMTNRRFRTTGVSTIKTKNKRYIICDK